MEVCCYGMTVHVWNRTMQYGMRKSGAVGFSRRSVGCREGGRELFVLVAQQWDKAEVG